MERLRILVSRPVIPAALLCAAGSAVGRAYCGAAAIRAFAALFAVAAAAWAAAFLFPFMRRRRMLTALAALFLFAAARAAWTQNRAIAAERCFAALCREDTHVTAVGEIATVFRAKPAAKGNVRHRFRLRNAVFRTHDDPSVPVALRGEVFVEWYAKPPEKGGHVPARGERIEVTGNVFARGDTEAAATLDDVFLVSGAGRTRILKSAASSPFARFRDSAAETLSRGLAAHPRERDLILAMTLGLKSAIPRETMDVFRRAGTIHVFAISGLHVGAIALMMVWFLSFLGVPRTFVVVPLAPLLAAYVYTTGMQPSAVRAALMVGIHFFGVFAGRRPDGLCTVSLALLLILLADPLAIAEVGLLMSFAMVGGIMLFARPVGAICRRLGGCSRLALDRALAIQSEAAGDQFARVYRWPKDFLILLWNGFVAVFAAALCAALVSFPLTACVFGTLVPYSLFANMVVVPLAFPVMAIAGAGLFASAVVPGIVLATNRLAAALAWVMCFVSEKAAALPFSASRADFPVWGLVVWYAALAALLRGLPGVCKPVLRADEPRLLDI